MAQNQSIEKVEGGKLAKAGDFFKSMLAGIFVTLPVKAWQGTSSLVKHQNAARQEKKQAVLEDSMNKIRLYHEHLLSGEVEKTPEHIFELHQQGADLLENKKATDTQKKEVEDILSHWEKSDPKLKSHRGIGRKIRNTGRFLGSRTGIFAITLSAIVGLMGVGFHKHKQDQEHDADTGDITFTVTEVSANPKNPDVYLKNYAEKGLSVTFNDGSQGTICPSTDHKLGTFTVQTGETYIADAKGVSSDCPEAYNFNKL